MGQGTTPPPGIADSAATSSAAGTQNTPALTDQQAKAIAMLMSQMGKSTPAFSGLQGQPIQQTYPQTSTVQGGTYFNPSQQR